MTTPVDYDVLTEHVTEDPTLAAPGHCTDVGNGREFVADHRAVVRYVPAWGWVVWDGRRWGRDAAGRVQELAKATVARLFAQATAELSALAGDQVSGQSVAERKTAVKAAQARLAWALKSEDARRIGAMLTMARSDPRIVAAADQFDADPFAFNVVNGTLDLRSATLRPHRREDYITRLAPVEYRATATAPAWDRFIGSVFGDDAELIGWLQRWCGYAATGDVREQVIAILWGGGSNGKSTFVETLLDLLGDYGHKANAEMLLASQGDRHETEKAALAGRRLVAACETGEGRRLNETLVKECTGGDRITARFMRQDHFTFSPTFKLAVSTNHRPEIRGMDQGIWRRIRLVPFTRRFWKDSDTPGPPELRADPGMRDALKAELPGILRWIVIGAADWHTWGLGTCSAVTAATSEYREAEDRVAEFVEERCRRGPTEGDDRAEVKASALFAAYKAWSEGRNERPLTQTMFGSRLSDMGFTRRKSHGTKMIVGLDLMSRSEDI